ncbi:acid protease [Polychaeton citri CBS 116435]|uniref:Acid protease n=1 Tax=Polychaeton citri CBS 116435 TaxID=1314669 RepID=A0A9P4UMJ2_9PEZI|nr:acid protease [Polychaeton citri CBS 116435]
MATAGPTVAGGSSARLASGNTPLIPVQGGQVFLAPIQVGGQQFFIVIDTGSSDPWLVSSGFQCVDPSTYQQVAQYYCYFGPSYDHTVSTTYSAVANQNFNVSYADGEFLNGDMASERMTFAGITVPQQKFGVVDRAAWYGDGYSSGLIGFAYRSITSAYQGGTPSRDIRGQAVPYDPLFVSMYKQNLTTPLFSMAIRRDDSDGGLMGIGGIPDVKHGIFINAPIQPVGVNGTDGGIVYEFYSVTSGGFAVSADPRAQFNLFGNANPRKTTVLANQTSVIVDSGTSLMYVPEDVTQAAVTAFTPAATWSDNYMAYRVQCGATPPVFGVAISSKIFFVNPADMIIDIGGGVCISAVQSNHNGYSILGDAWMKNVLAVFDIGAQQMRFASRQFY